MKQINTNKAPKAVGPYSQAIKSGEFVFCAGQIGIDPKTGELVEGTENQTKQVLENLSAVLEAEELSLKNVVKSDIFITDMSDYSKVNEIYGQYFSSDPKPARVTVAVAALPKEALIEISCIASIE